MKSVQKLSIFFILATVFCSTESIFAKNSKAAANWNGTWSYASRYSPAGLKITKQTAGQFTFTLNATNGANMGEISGVAKIVGNKAYFNDRLSKEKDAGKYGCKVTFINKKTFIDVEANQECMYYGGNAVYFSNEFKKGKNLPYLENDFVDIGVFDNAKTDAAFKKLTGKDYENFLNSFHIIYDEEDLDKLNTKVYSACVRGICPWTAGIIMFDKTGNFYAMVFTAKEDSPESDPVNIANYYSNNKKYADKLPLTIKKWFDEKMGEDGKIEIIYKNKP